MKTLLETTARATDVRHLELDAPLASLPSAKVKVIVQVESDAAPKSNGAALTCEEWLKQVPSMREVFPDAPWQGTDDYMREMREGEQR